MTKQTPASLERQARQEEETACYHAREAQRLRREANRLRRTRKYPAPDQEKKG